MWRLRRSAPRGNSALTNLGNQEHATELLAPECIKDNVSN